MFSMVASALSSMLGGSSLFSWRNIALFCAVSASLAITATSVHVARESRLEANMARSERDAALVSLGELKLQFVDYQRYAKKAIAEREKNESTHEQIRRDVESAKAAHRASGTVRAGDHIGGADLDVLRSAATKANGRSGVHTGAAGKPGSPQTDTASQRQ